MPTDAEQAGQPGRVPGAAEMAGFIRAHREEILRRWVRATRAELPLPSVSERRLVDHLPAILDHLAEGVERASQGRPIEGGEDGPDVHAMERLESGFDLEEVATEYRLLRRCVLELAREHVPELVAGSVEVLNEAIDLAVARSVARFSRSRARTLEALDRLTREGLAAPSLDALLSGLLQVLVQTVPAVDAASLFLREGDRLRVRANAGLTVERGSFSLQVGEGFVGAVAARRQPMLVRSAADPLVRSEFLRRRGIRALYGVPLLDHRGEVIGVVNMGSLTAHDFSEEDKLLLRTLTSRAAAVIIQHVLRDEVAERARQLRHAETLLSVHPDFFFLMDREHRVTWANPALLRLWGRPLEEAVGRSLEELEFPKHLVELHRGQMDRVFRGQITTGTNAYTSPAGETRVYENVLAPVFGTDGAVEAVAGVSRDVTERFRAEQARADALSRERSAREEAEQALALLDSLLAASPVGFAFLDRELRYVRINESLAKVNGLPVKEHFGRRTRDVIPEQAAVLDPQLRRILETGESLLNREFQAAPPSTPDTERTFLASFFPVRIPGGQILGVGAVVVEITDRKQMEEELRQAVQVRERVMSILSHDLRSPLSVVTAGAALLRRGGGLEEQELRTVARISRAGDRMGRMIRDLLDYARATGGGIPIERRPVNLLDVARLALDEMRAAYPGGRLELVPLEGDFGGEWDPDRLEQLLANLLSNAIQYSPPGSPVELRIDGRDPDRVALEVHNGGVPIPEDALPSLFQPFHRGAASDAASPGGLGLGLFIVRQIAEKHGGSVTVHSTGGEGTTFRVVLPRR